jgi:hypothetical protein
MKRQKRMEKEAMDAQRVRPLRARYSIVSSGLALVASSACIAVMPAFSFSFSFLQEQDDPSGLLVDSSSLPNFTKLYMLSSLCSPKVTLLQLLVPMIFYMLYFSVPAGMRT